MDSNIIHNYFSPSILLSELFFPYINEKNVMLNALQKVVNMNFYKGAEITIISDTNNKRRIREISKKYDISLTQWFTFLFIEEKINISSLDKGNRTRSTRRVMETLYDAAECGVKNVALISGDNIEENLRNDAYKATYESLCEICVEANKYNINILLEPLDSNAHKKKLFGPTADSVALINKIKNTTSNIGLSWDTAHSALCEENILDSMSIANEVIIQLHLSNAVLKKNHPLFGDYHMPMGSPGFLTLNKARDIFDRAINISLFGTKKPFVSVEIRTQKGIDPWEIEKKSREFIINAWSKLKHEDN